MRGIKRVLANVEVFRGHGESLRRSGTQGWQACHRCDQRCQCRVAKTWAEDEAGLERPVGVVEVSGCAAWGSTMVVQVP